MDRGLECDSENIQREEWVQENLHCNWWVEEEDEVEEEGDMVREKLGVVEIRKMVVEIDCHQVEQDRKLKVVEVIGN
jgi:hypothetical protein